MVFKDIVRPKSLKENVIMMCHMIFHRHGGFPCCEFLRVDIHKFSFKFLDLKEKQKEKEEPYLMPPSIHMKCRVLKNDKHKTFNKMEIKKGSERWMMGNWNGNLFKVSVQLLELLFFNYSASHKIYE